MIEHKATGGDEAVNASSMSSRRLSSGRRIRGTRGGGGCVSFGVLARATAAAAAFSTCTVCAMPIRSSAAGVAVARATPSTPPAGGSAGEVSQHHGRKSPLSSLTSKRRTRKAQHEDGTNAEVEVEHSRVRRKKNGEQATRRDTDRSQSAVDPHTSPTQSTLEVDAVRGSSTTSRVAFFPGGGRGCLQNVPYLVKPSDCSRASRNPSGRTGAGASARVDAAALAFTWGRPAFVTARIRGGGSGRHPWFTSCSENEVEDEQEYNTEDEEEHEDSVVEGEEGAVIGGGGGNTFGEGSGEGLQDQPLEVTAGGLETSVAGKQDKVDAVPGHGGHEGLASRGEGGDVEGSLGDAECVARVAAGMDGDTSDEGDGDDDDDASEMNGGSRHGENGEESGEEDGESSPAPPADADADAGAEGGASLDVYKRTIARRFALRGVFAVVRKALLRMAIMLLTFQIVPWLHDKPLVRWLLVLSLLLHTADEVSRTLFSLRSGQEKDSDAGDVKGSSRGSNSGKSHSSGVGLLGGLLRAANPEHEQHFEFYRLNDAFERDVEALTMASRSKAEMASLLAASAAEESRMFGVNAMKSLMGFSASHGDKAQDNGEVDASKGKSKNKKKKSDTKEKEEVCEEETPSEQGCPSGSRPSAGANDAEVAGSASGVNVTEAGSADAGGDEKGGGVRKRVFVVHFESGKFELGTEQEQLELLSNAVGFLVSNGNSTTDEVVLCLESGGGEVTTYGLASAKLARLRDSGIRLTVCVDKVAASGGYMMACVADWLVAAPFAMLGSIGVLGGIPNFNKVLRRAGIDYYHFTAGRNKSLVGPFQEVTKRQEAKQQQQLDSVHSAFKRHIRRYRPSVDVDAVGTGDVWLGLDALEVQLADEVSTAGQYIHRRLADSDVFVVRSHRPRTMKGMSMILRQLLFGPLAYTGRFASSVVTIAEAVNRLTTASGGDASGVFPGFCNEGFWNGGRSSPTGVFTAASGLAASSTCGFVGSRCQGSRGLFEMANARPFARVDEQRVLGGLLGNFGAAHGGHDGATPSDSTTFW